MLGSVCTLFGTQYQLLKRDIASQFYSANESDP